MVWLLLLLLFIAAGRVFVEVASATAFYHSAAAYIAGHLFKGCSYFLIFWHLLKVSAAGTLLSFDM